MYALYVELSLPKLLYGNNLFEITNDDYPRLLSMLQDSIHTITSMWFNLDDISQAVITRWDIGKNIVSSMAGFTLDVLDLMSKQDISRRFDLTSQTYIKDDRTEDGHGIRYHTKTREFVLYDKKQDMIKEGRGVTRMLGTNATSKRKLLIKKLDDMGLSALRLEMRYRDTKTIRNILRDVGSPRSPTFRELFDSDLVKKIVNHEWEKHTQNIAVAELDKDEPYEIVTNLLKAGVNVHKALEALGLQQVINQEGVRKYRTLIDTYGLRHSWPATKQLLNSYPKTRNESIQIVDEALKEFRPIKPF
jgi:hypothetical protein